MSYWYRQEERHEKTILRKAREIVESEDPEVAAEAMRSWASGYLLKKCAGKELIKAIREVLRGSTYVTPKVAPSVNI